ncbi:MAG: pilus assembly protein N-terminal domain-containing protein, partial [Polyangiaceae bacterium]
MCARVGLAAATILFCIGLTANVAHAQRGHGGGGGGQEPSPGDEIQIAIGESKTLSAKNIKNYSDSNPGIADIRLTPAGDQFIISGKKPGQTTLLLINDDGSQIQY